MSQHRDIPERIEQAALADLFAAAPENVRSELGLSAERTAGGVILACTGLDSLFLNRAIGGNAEALARAASHFREQGIERFFLQPSSSAEPGRVAEALAPLGIEPYKRSWMKFLRRPSSTSAPPSALGIRRAEPREAAACAAILSEGFEMPEAFAPVFEALIGRPRWHVYAAHDAGEPVAVGVLFVDGPLSYCAFGATRPSHRRRGAQGALLAHRIRVASELGCEWIATETGEIVESEPNPSYHNIVRVGFEPVHKRPNFAPRGTLWHTSATDAATERRTGS